MTPPAIPRINGSLLFFFSVRTTLSSPSTWVSLSLSPLRLSWALFFRPMGLARPEVIFRPMVIFLAPGRPARAVRRSGGFPFFGPAVFPTVGWIGAGADAAGTDGAGGAGFFVGIIGTGPFFGFSGACGTIGVGGAFRTVGA